MKVLFVTGGVLSSLGKGTLAASVAKVLDSGGVNTRVMKIDPYLNVDAGMLNPFEHGEVFVTRDGFECDMDLGIYQRFLGIPAVRAQNVMMGSVLHTLIEKERTGDASVAGEDIQLIPHATGELKNRIKHAFQATKCDLLIVEIGGTVGDLEAEVVLEAARQLKTELKDDAIFLHLALVPRILTGELKTKPLQHSVAALHGRGINPDLIVARADSKLPEKLAEKIAFLCGVSREDVFSSPDVKLLYELPLAVEGEKLPERIAEKLSFKLGKRDLGNWRKLVEKSSSGLPLNGIKVAVVGKYAHSKDAYASVFESLGIAGIHSGASVQADLVSSEKITDENASRILGEYDGIIVTGGYGSRGVPGKISAIKFAREGKKPFLGLCYGLQLAVVEFSRDVCGLKGANTTEVDPETEFNVVDFLASTKGVKKLGGTQRLGAEKTVFSPGTLAHSVYGKEAMKTHRHRWEINSKFVGKLEEKGFKVSGKNASGLVDVMELPSHPFFIGTQFHPEFDSTFETPEPLFKKFVGACAVNKA